jgi:hypothetical protein
MSTRTLGTNATTTLTAVPFPNLNNSATPQSDIAAVQQAIADDTPLAFSNAGQLGNALPTNTPINVYLGAGAFSNNGLLIVPNRGVLKVWPGDWVGVDAYGWPILVSGRSIVGVTGGPAVSWTHSGATT